MEFIFKTLCFSSIFLSMPSYSCWVEGIFVTLNVSLVNLGKTRDINHWIYISGTTLSYKVNSQTKTGLGKTESKYSGGYDIDFESSKDQKKIPPILVVCTEKWQIPMHVKQKTTFTNKDQAKVFQVTIIWFTLLILKLIGMIWDQCFGPGFVKICGRRIGVRWG